MEAVRAKFISMAENHFFSWKQCAQIPILSPKASFFDGDWSLERREMWSVFIKRMHIEDLLFEELFQTCQKFMEPLWDAIQKDEIFFGDWMPEPERFI